MKRFLATAIVAALIITAPGLPCYAAVSAIVQQGSVATVPGGMQGPARGIAPVSPLSNIQVSLSPLGLKATLAPQTNAPLVQSLAAPQAQAPGAVVAPVESVPTPGPVLSELGGSADIGRTALTGRAVALPVSDSAAPQKGPMGLKQLLKETDSLALSADKVAGMSEGAAKTSAASIMDRILGLVPAPASSDDAVAASGASRSQTGLVPASAASALASKASPPSAVPAAQPSSARGRVAGTILSVGRMALAGGAVFGLQVLAASLLPAVFGLVPVAAVWAVSSGILLLPAALYARYRLSLRDSPRLTKVKWVMDAAIGAFLGAAAIAAPSLGAVLSLQHAALAGVPLLGMIAGRLAGSGSPFLDSLGVWGSLAGIPLVLGLGAAGALGAGPLLGMMSLPIMTTLSFFLGRIIFSAETGRPFSIPGSLQKMRFPVYQWVMIGVPFALLTGFGAVYTNYAFGAWQFLGDKHYSWDKSAPLWKNLLNNLLNFNNLYLGLLAFTAATGFTSPLTFLVIAFAPERAAKWTEALLGKLLPKAAPAPSTQAKPLADPDAGADKPSRWPNFHYRLKTGLLIGGMALSAVAMAFGVFGVTSLLKNLGIAAAITGLQFFFSTWLLKKIMKVTPATESEDPEFFAVIKDLRERINAKREAQGKKPIPMPEMVNDPLEAPNAYATGRDPFHALVGVTKVMKEMTLTPEGLRAGLIRLLAASDPESKSFKVYRKAIAGSLAGVSANATPREVADIVKAASDADLKTLGVRALRGVMAHEMSHVMDRHMLLGTVAGAINSAVSFASYGVMWAVGHAQAALKSLKDRIFPPAQKPGGKDRVGLEPISTGVAAGSLLALARLFAALWGPVVLQITQMAAGRSNEGMADEDGGILSDDPASLALALGLLTSWRPSGALKMKAERLPIVAANAHLYTVNPLEQWKKAGVLPAFDKAMEYVVGKADDFLFNLFITHPDTTQRIERLYDMSEAKDAGVRP